MNIKSELNKPFVLFKSLTIGMVVFAIVVATILMTLIIAVGEGFWFKILFLVVASIIALVSAYESAGLTDDEKTTKAKQNGIIIIMVFLIVEIGLFFHSSSYSKTISMVVVPGIITESISTGKTDKDGKTIYEDKSFKTIEFYNADNNDRVGYRKVDDMSPEKLKLFTSITGKEYYIDYFPFFTYSEEFRYIRK